MGKTKEKEPKKLDLSIEIKNKIEIWEVGDLKPYDKNARTHSEEQVKQIANSIKEFGFTNPLLISIDGLIIAGHGRLEAAKQIGLESVPVIVLDHLTDEQRRAYTLADNKLALNAGWDIGLLSEELRSLDELDFDLEVIGFSDEELDEMLFPEEEPEEETGSDNIPSIPDEPKTKLGDIWVLDNHRLMCGDATVLQSVERLLNGNKIDMVFTDPPYGVSERTNRGTLGRGKITQCQDFSEIIGDHSTETAVDSFNLCLSLNPTIMIFWGANYYAKSLPEISSWIIWDKRDGVASDDNADCEMAWCNTGKPARIFSHLWKGCIKASEHGSSRVHPTQKPIALAQWCFENIGSENEKILDLFGGSGSTLIAAENTKRKSFLMELDPKYCDVIIKRWQELTGKEAVLEGTKETFNSK